MTGPSGVDHEDEKKPVVQSAHINLKVNVHQNSGKEGLFFRIKRNTQMKKLMDACCDQKSLEMKAIDFLFDGFHYDPTSHNVVQVNQMDFRFCNITAPLKTYESGNDSFTIKGPGHYYFICSFPGHYKGGQKLDVRVLKKYPMTATPPPKPIAMAPSSVANVVDPSSLFGRIVLVSILCVAIWVA